MAGRSNRLMARIAALALILALAGCGDQKSSQAGSSGGPAGGQVLRIGMVTDVGGTDDASFNAAGAAGLKRAGDELRCETKFLESREQADYQTNLSTLAEAKYDFIIALGYMMEEAVEHAAKDFPETKFAIVDGNAPALPNAAALQFREEEGSFLAGYLAAKMSRKNAVAFLGGIDVPVLRRFEAGYTAGARTADPSIRVIVKYVGKFDDPTTGSVMAEQMLKDADIIFAAAGKSGLGALKACASKGRGYYGIGSDSDQDGLYPGRVLTSMMKRVDTVVFNSIKAMKDGNWKPGEQTFGLKEQGVHLSVMKHTKQDVPKEVLAELEQIKSMIANGTLNPPRTREELSAFQAPSLPSAGP